MTTAPPEFDAEILDLAIALDAKLLPVKDFRRELFFRFFALNEEEVRQFARAISDTALQQSLGRIARYEPH